MSNHRLITEAARVLAARLEDKSTTPIPLDVYKASQGSNPTLWKNWYTSMGYSVDKATNRLTKDGSQWRITPGKNQLEKV